MHELQFMTNLVRMVEEVCKKESRITPSIITLQVASNSHLAQHTIEDLQTMFDFVSRNTLAQGAKLAVTTKNVKGTCRTCHTQIDCHPDTVLCPHCSSVEIEKDETPEVLIKNIKYIESPQ